MSSTFDLLIADLTKDARRAQPRDALQFCANWFNQRLQEQRTRLRDIFEQQQATALAPRTRGSSFPDGLYQDASPAARSRPPPEPRLAGQPQLHMRRSMPTLNPGPFDNTNRIPNESLAAPRTAASVALPRLEPARRPSAGPSPFGTLNIPGNAAINQQSALRSVSDQHPMSVQPHRTFLSIREEDDASDASSHHSLTIPTHNLPPSTRSVSPFAPPNGQGGFLGPPASALGRRVSVSAESISPSSGPERPPPFFPKTPDQMQRLEEAVGDAFLFRKLDRKKRSAVLGAMQEVTKATGEAVITQGEDGDYFYVVDSGTLDCFKWDEPRTEPTAAQKQAGWHPEFGRKVFAYERGGTFGELALMYYAKRAATVVTTSPCTLWALDRVTFQTILLDMSAATRRSYESFLGSVPLLESLNDSERAKLADVLQSREYADNQVVVREGELGRHFYIIEEGQAEALKKVKDEHGNVTGEEVVKKYQPGDYFGELALLHRAPRAATVRAIRPKGQPNLKVAVLDADAFQRLLGPLQDLMERSAATLYSNPSSPVQAFPPQ